MQNELQGNNKSEKKWNGRHKNSTLKTTKVISHLTDISVRCEIICFWKGFKNTLATSSSTSLLSSSSIGLLHLISADITSVISHQITAHFAFEAPWKWMTLDCSSLLHWSEQKHQKRLEND